ncbi:MAG: LysR family transcriptional regulator [Rhizobiaceae bacterium]|nr:LysR family transcriptional regulator [Rhizobiaceae bacterium]
MNWDDYRFFLAVARTGKLSSAGQQLGVDHATVGRRVKALEEALKVHLFDRSPQGYSLTDEGHKLVTMAEGMETSAIAAQSEFSGEADSVSGVVRIGAPEGMATSILAEVAVRLCEQHPKLELQIVAMPRTFSLTKREADIAIAVSAPTSGRLKFRKITDYTLHMYATKEYLANNPPIKDLADLQRVRGIGYVSDLIYDKELDYIPLISPDAKPFLTSTSVHVQLEAALANGGLCVLHDFIACKYPQLVRVMPEEVSFTRTFWYIVHEDYAKLHRIRVVSDALIEHVRKRVNKPS